VVGDWYSESATLACRVSPETSVLNNLTLSNNPEDGRILFNGGGSVRSCIEIVGFSDVCVCARALFVD
jgi:hypothetical protein